MLGLVHGLREPDVGSDGRAKEVEHPECWVERSVMYLGEEGTNRYIPGMMRRSSFLIKKIYKRLIEVVFFQTFCLGKAHSPVHPLYPFYISRLDPGLGIVPTHDRRELAGCRSFVFHVLELSATESSRYLTSRYLSLPRRRKKKRTEFSLIPGRNLIARSLL